MRTLIKIIAALLVLIIAILIAIPFLIDPNDYKAEISQQVEKATGRQLTIQGDIGLSVFPWVALDLGEISLSNAPDFEADQFASVNRARIRIKLLPLLKKEVEMDTVVLDGLVLNLETNKEGQTNWADLAGNTEDSIEEAVDVVEDASDSSTPALKSLNIAGVKLTNANILWSDASKNQNYQLRNLNLDADTISPNSPADIKMNFDLISATPDLRAHITLNTTAEVDLKNERYKLNKLNLTTVAQSQDIGFSQANITLRTDVDADMASQQVTVKGLNLNTDISTPNQEQLVAELTTDVLANLASQLFTLDQLTIDGKISGENIPGESIPFNLNTRVVADLDKETLVASDLAIHIRDLLLNAHLNVAELLSDDLKFNGNVQIKPFNLRKLAKDIGIELPEMADTSTLETFALSTELSGSNNHINTQNLNVTLDQSKLTGQFGIRNFEKPGFTFDLLLDQIDADRYLPPASEETSKPTATPSTAAAEASDELPLDALRDINAKGTFKIGKLKISGIHTENISITIDANDGLVKLTPLQADLYQGTYRGNVNLDARTDALKLSIDEKLQGVQVGPLLSDLTGDAKISGIANVTVKLTGQGESVDSIKKTLNGQGNLSFTNGAVKGINIAELLRRAQATLSGQTLAASTEPVATDFSSLNGSFTINNGVIANDDLEMQSPLLRVNGAGQVNLPEEQLDYGLRVAVVGTLEGQGGQALTDLRGLTIPLRIRGSFDDPKPSVDLASVLKDRATSEVKARAEEKIRERLGDNVGNLLGGALGGSSPNNTSDNTDNKDEESSPEEQPSLEDQLKDDVKNRLRSLF